MYANDNCASAQTQHVCTHTPYSIVTHVAMHGFNCWYIGRSHNFVEMEHFHGLGLILKARYEDCME